MKSFIQTLAALAIFFQALIPLGFMPNINAGGPGTALVICSGFDMKTIYVDASGRPVKPGKPSHQTSPCPYAGLTAFNRPELFRFTPVAVSYTKPVLLAWSSQAPAQPKFLLPAATGPPILL